MKMAAEKRILERNRERDRQKTRKGTRDTQKTIKGWHGPVQGSSRGTTRGNRKTTWEDGRKQDFVSGHHNSLAERQYRLFIGNMVIYKASKVFFKNQGYDREWPVQPLFGQGLHATYGGDSNTKYPYPRHCMQWESPETPKHHKTQHADCGNAAK